MGDSGESKTERNDALRARLITMFTKFPDGLPDAEVKKEMGDGYKALVPIINVLLGERRLSLFQSGDGALVYKLIEEQTAEKFKGFNAEQWAVYRKIEASGNSGIWTRDIRFRTGIKTQLTLNKILSFLEQRQLVKSVKSIQGKNKKVYMLFDLTPSREITGGPWYNEQEFDYAFIEALQDFITKCVQAMRMASLEQLTEKVRISGISKVILGPEEVLAVMQTLVYDGAIEEVRAPRQLARLDIGTKMFKVCRPVEDMDHLTTTPCGICEVQAHCSPGNVISPDSCIYLDKWLDLEDIGMDME